MATATLDVTSVLAATGWTGATVTNLSTSNDVRATGGTAGELIRGELSNAPGDFSSMSAIQLHVEARTVGSVSRQKDLTIELLDSGDNVLQTFSTTTGVTSTDTTFNTTNWSRTDSAATVDGYRFRVTVTEGGGMGDSATVEIDRIWATLTYTPTTTVTGTGAATLPAITASGAGARHVDGTGAATLPAATASGTGKVVQITGTGAATLPSVTASGSGEIVAPFIKFMESRTITTLTASPLNFTGVDFDTADPNRYILVIASAALSTADITGMTIGGVTATKIADSQGAGDATGESEIWGAAVPTGTSGTVSITTDGDANMGIGVFRMLKPKNGLTPHDTGTEVENISSTGADVILDIPANGQAIGAQLSYSATSTSTVTGATERYDESVGGTQFHTGGETNFFATLQTNHTIAWTLDSPTGTVCAVSASFEQSDADVLGTGAITLPSITASGSGTVTIAFVSYLGSAVDPNSSSAYSFTSQPLGEADSNRYILVAASTAGSSSVSDTAEITSVTVAGQSATKVVGVEASGTGRHFHEHWLAAVPTGTTGTVVVNCDSGVSCGILLYRLQNPNTTVHDTGTDFETNDVGTNNVLSTTIDYVDGGCTINTAQFQVVGSSAATFTGVATENVDEQIDGSGPRNHAGASEIRSSTQTAQSQSVSFSGDGGTNIRTMFVVSSWEQAATTVTGTGAVTLPAITASGTGTITRVGTGAPTLPAITASGTGEITRTGAGAATLPAVTISGTGTITRVGTGAATLPGITASGTGTVTVTVTGTGAATLPAVTASGSGTVTFVLEAADISNANPLDTPTLTEDSGDDDLVSTDLTNANPLDTPTFTQEHALGSTDLTNTNPLDTPTLGHEYNLTATDIQNATTVGNPIISFSPVSISNSVNLTQPTLAQEHALTADELTNTNPLDVPVLAAGGLEAEGLTIGVILEKPQGKRASITLWDFPPPREWTDKETM